MANIICSNCKTENPPDNLFCLSCGTSLKDVKPLTGEETVIAPRENVIVPPPPPMPTPPPVVFAPPILPPPLVAPPPKYVGHSN